MTQCILTSVVHEEDLPKKPVRKDVCFDFVPPIPRVGEEVRTDFDGEFGDYRVREVSYLFQDGSPPNVFLTLDLIETL